MPAASWSTSASSRGSPARAVTPEAINIMSARAGGEIARLPLGEAAAQRAGAPYWVIHRADLQAALQAAVNDHPDIDLRLGCQFEDVTSHAKGLTVVQRRGNARQQELAVALIGADGIWSSVRHHLFPDVQPQFSGLIAWRGTLDATALPREYTSRAGAALDGTECASRRLSDLRRRARSMSSRSCRAPGTGRAGARRARPTTSRARSAARWPATARMMVDAVDEWRRWALFTVPDIGEWSDGAIALLGDAAHAMLPFAAQGAGMAIEDAAVLAKALERQHRRQRRGHPGGAEALRRSAPRPRAAGAARRAAAGTDLSSHRTDGAGPRPRHQGDGPATHAGAAGLDLRLAGVTMQTILANRHCERSEVPVSLFPRHAEDPVRCGFRFHR